MRGERGVGDQGAKTMTGLGCTERAAERMQPTALRAVLMLDVSGPREIT